MARVSCLAALLIGLLSTSGANAVLVYTVDLSFPANHIGSGNIDIDGTISLNAPVNTTLNDGDEGSVFAWDLTFSNPGGTVDPRTINQHNSQFAIDGNATVTATATGLEWSIPVAPDPDFSDIFFYDPTPFPLVSLVLSNRPGSMWNRVELVQETPSGGTLRAHSLWDPVNGSLLVSGAAPVPEPTVWCVWLFGTLWGASRRRPLGNAA